MPTFQKSSVKMSALRPAKWNPRTISDARFKNLCRSLQNDPEFMELRPILATKDGTIYAGNMRFRAAEHLKWKQIPAIFTDIPENLAKERALKDNNQFGEWQMDDLSSMIEDMREMGSEIDDLGFSDKMDDLVNPEEEIVEDEAPLVPKKAKTRVGDLYVLGAHRLLCGDATIAKDVRKLMGDTQADMIFTDPPYNVDYGAKNDYLNETDRGNRNNATIENDKMEDGPFRAFLSAAFAAAGENLKKGGAVYVCHADSEGINFRSAFVSAGWLLKQCLIWVKNNHVLGRQDYQWKHEPILYGWKDGGGHCWYGGRSETTVWEIAKPSKSEEHPTMKPVELCAKAIVNSSEKGQCVLDSFGGSGSTMVACEQLGRTCFMLELEPKYCDVIVKRWENLTGKKATKTRA